MKICFETFGCRLNRAEALQDEARYLAAGHQLAEGHADAELIIVRGCSVTARAQRDCEKMIAHLKRKYPGKQIAVTGCLKVENAAKPPPIAEPKTAIVPTRTARAYLKVQDGCDAKCTFCIVPKFRGRSVSKAFAEAIDEARRFIDAGYHELVVTGCNLSLYLSGGKRLPELLASLSELASDVRIRLGSIEPGSCAREVVAVMGEHQNFCRCLHLPIQSGSDVVLHAMQRPYRVKDIEEVIAQACQLMPRLGLGCDVMVGFPGESIRDFQATQQLLSQLPFSNAHIFPYSERPETPAASLPGSVAKAMRSSRAHLLSKISTEKRQRFARMFVGHSVEVVIESESQNRGWTSEYLPCTVMHIGNGKPIHRKELVSARVVDFANGMLVAVQNS